MDIESFYDADPRRRASEELQFGVDWRDAHGRRYELNWVADTGELYVLQEKAPDMWVDPFGDFVVVGPAPEDLGVRIIKLVHGEAEVRTLLAGWEDTVHREDSVAWLIDRLRTSHTT